MGLFSNISNQSKSIDLEKLQLSVFLTKLYVVLLHKQSNGRWLQADCMFTRCEKCKLLLLLWCLVETCYCPFMDYDSSNRRFRAHPCQNIFHWSVQPCSSMQYLVGEPNRASNMAGSKYSTNSGLPKESNRIVIHQSIRKCHSKMLYWLLCWWCNTLV